MSLRASKDEFQRGFTIVELLIVVVVIAVLAVITVISFQGIQQRAGNAVLIDAASKSLRMVMAYNTVKGAYPYSSGDSCITTTNGCANSTSAVTSVAAFETNISTVGTLPRTVPISDVIRYGVMYTYVAGRTFNGEVRPAAILYYLFGTSQQCGVAGVTDSYSGVMLASTTGYTTANFGGKTACVISIPPPA